MPCPDNRVATRHPSFPGEIGRSTSPAAVRSQRAKSQTVDSRRHDPECRIDAGDHRIGSIEFVGLCAEVGDDRPAVRALEAQHVRPPGVDPRRAARPIAARGAAPAPGDTASGSSRGRRPAPAPTRAPNHSGCGRWAPSSPKPNELPLRVHGSGTRHPSRPASNPGLRKKVGSCRCGVVDLGDFVQAQLLALVQVGRARAARARREWRPARAEVHLHGRVRAACPPTAATRCRACARAARLRRAPDAAVRSAWHAGRRRGWRAPTSSTIPMTLRARGSSVTMLRNWSASKSASSRSKLNAWPRLSALA